MNWKDDSKVNDQLKKQFDNYLPDTDVPDDLKEEVFNTLDHINLAAEVFELFTGKFGRAEVQLISLLNNKKEK